MPAGPNVSQEQFVGADAHDFQPGFIDACAWREQVDPLFWIFNQADSLPLLADRANQTPLVGGSSCQGAGRREWRAGIRPDKPAGVERVGWGSLGPEGCCHQ